VWTAAVTAHGSAPASFNCCINEREEVNYGMKFSLCPSLSPLLLFAFIAVIDWREKA
jgi:hypothetical protein